jgi:large subunit ribosomal protein L3
MAGHMGVDTVTIKNRPVMAVYEDKSLIAIKGPVPGANNGYVYIKF